MRDTKDEEPEPAPAPPAPRAPAVEPPPVSEERVAELAEAFATLEIGEAQRAADERAPPLPKIDSPAPFSHYVNIPPLFRSFMF